MKWSTGSRYARAWRVLSSVSLLSAGWSLLSCERGTPTDLPSRPSGSIVWRLPEIRSPLDAGELAVDSLHVYAYNGGLEIKAVRLADHQIAWTAGVDETLDNSFSPRGIAACSGRVIYGSYLVMYAVSAADGVRQWRWRPSLGGGFGTAAPICKDGTVYVATTRPMYIYAIDVITGQEKWAANLGRNSGGNGFVATPRMEDGVVVGCTREFSIPAGGMIAGVDARTGQLKWQFEWTPLAPSIERSCAVSVAVGGGFAVGAADDGRIFGLDLQRGTLRWTAPPVPNFVSPRDERPVWITDGVVIAGSGSGVVTGFDLGSGTQVWRTADDAKRVLTTLLDPLLGSQGRFFGLNTSGSALAFEATTGRRVWTYQPSGGINDGKLFGPGVLTSDLFIAIGSDGLYALKR